MDADYKHEIVNHAVEYVRAGNVHTNGIENFWSLLKRGLHGTYVSVEPFHLFGYLDEQMFRYNNRKDMTDADRFALLCSQVAGRRLTWNEVTSTAANAGTRTVDQIIYWLAYLHFGRVNGIGIPCSGPGLCDSTTKFIWATFGLAPAAMFVTGAAMWWNRVIRKKVKRVL